MTSRAGDGYETKPFWNKVGDWYQKIERDKRNRIQLALGYIVFVPLLLLLIAEYIYVLIRYRKKLSGRLYK